MVLRNTIKSWTYTTAGFPETLQLTDTTVPAQPAAHHVLVQIHAASLNPVDVQLMNHPVFNLPYLNWPKHVARDFSGVILAASPESGYAKGDEICGCLMDFGGGVGGLTEVLHLDVRKPVITRKPPHLSHVQAAALPLVYLTARTALAYAEPAMSVNEDNRLVVLGASSAVGIHTVRLAKSLGWTVLGSCSSRNADYVHNLGADVVVDYTRTPTSVRDAVRKFHPAVIIDCVGGTETIGLARRYVTIVGDKSERATVGGSVLYLTRPRMMLRWMLGRFGMGMWHSYDCINLSPKQAWLDEINDLPPDEVVIDSTYGFADVKEAYERLNSGRCRGKVVVEVIK